MEELKELLTKLNTEFIEISNQEIFIPCPIDRYKTMQPLKSFNEWLKSNQAIVIDDYSAGIHVFIDNEGTLNWVAICNEDYDGIFKEYYNVEENDKD